MQATRTADHDNVPWLAVLDAEVRRRGAHNLERRGRVQVHDGVPLLVGHLVDHAVPRVARVVDDDMNLAVTKLRSLLNKRLDICVVEHVACHGDGLAARGFNRRDDGFGFLCAFCQYVNAGLSV